MPDTTSADTADGIPAPVRQPKIGGGDFRLKATADGWAVSDWTTGVGRRTMHEGTDFAGGPVALLELIVTECLKHYDQEVIGIGIMRRSAGTKLLGFRPGWQAKQAAAREQKYLRTVDNWYRNVALLIKAMQVANWPMDVQALADYVESNLPKRIP